MLRAGWAGHAMTSDLYGPGSVTAKGGIIFIINAIALARDNEHGRRGGGVR